MRPYVYNPTQCFKCQRLWHTAASCKGKERCLKCAEAHNITSCTSVNPKCVNCSGNHRANSKECKKIRDAYEIERLRANGYSFLEAQDQVYRNRNSRQQVTDDDQIQVPLLGNHRTGVTDDVRNKPTYSSALRRQMVSTNNYVKEMDRSHSENVKILKETSTLTEESMFSSANKDLISTSSRDISIGTDFLVKLIDTICEAFQKKAHTESGEVRRNIVYSCFKHNFRDLPILNQTTSSQVAANNEMCSSDTEAEEVLSQDSLSNRSNSVSTQIESQKRDTYHTERRRNPKRDNSKKKVKKKNY